MTETQQAALALYQRKQLKAKLAQDDVVNEVIKRLPSPKYNDAIRAMLADVCRSDVTGLAWLLDGIEYCAHVPTPGRDEYGNRYSYYSEPINGSKVPRLAHLYRHEYGRVEIVD